MSQKVAHAASTLILAFSFIVAVAQSPPGRAQTGDPLSERIFALVNDFRTEQGLEELTRNARLAEAAEYFAAYLARSDKLDHDADGSTPANRVKQRGYDYCLVAENIAYEYSSRGFAQESLARNFVAGWKGSPSHRLNMLDPDATETGVAVAAGPKSGSYYAVQVFGRPQSARIRFRITNRSNATVLYKSSNRRVALQPRQTRTHEECRSGEIEFETTGIANPTLRPQHGAHYSIVRNGAGLRIDKER